MLRAILRNAGVEKRDAETLGIGITVRIKNWRSRWDLHPHSSRRQRAAFLFSYESEMVGSAGNAPVVASGFILRHPIYSRAAGSLPIWILVAGVGVAPTEVELMKLT